MYDDMEDLIFFVKLVVATILACIVIIGGGMAGIHYLIKYDCDRYGEVASLETDMAGTTCMINDPDLGWISYEERKASRIAEKVNR